MTEDARDQLGIFNLPERASCRTSLLRNEPLRNEGRGVPGMVVFLLSSLASGLQWFGKAQVSEQVQ